MAEPVLGPSSAGSVVLELGDTVGVLVIEATVELNGREIEISPVDGSHHHDLARDHDHAHDHQHDQAHARRTHSMVRERGTAAGKSYAAVYPGLGGRHLHGLAGPRHPGRHRHHRRRAGD